MGGESKIMTDKEFLDKLKEIIKISDNEGYDAIPDVMKLVDDYWELENSK
jgi:hypothetical protein